MVGRRVMERCFDETIHCRERVEGNWEGKESLGKNWKGQNS